MGSRTSKPTNKRKAPATAAGDSDIENEIVVHIPSSQPAKKKRRVLAEEDPDQVHNKRYAVLQCVLIPPLSENDAKEIARYDSAHSASLVRDKIRFLDKTVTKDAGTKKVLQKVSSRPSAKNAVPDPNPVLDTTVSTDGETGRRRPRRAASRRSYVIDLPSDVSGDEYSGGETLKSDVVVKAKRPSKKPVEKEEDSSDYDDGAGASEDDYEVDGSDVDESSVATASEDDFSDNERSVKKSSKTAPKKSAGQSGGVSKPRSAPLITGKRGATRMVDLMSRRNGLPKGLDLSLPPLCDIEDIFGDITKKAQGLGLTDVIEHLRNRRLRVATMCSGTESPILGVRMIQGALGGDLLQVEHVFSAEIVPFKQAYIERNFSPPVIFRDITELTEAVKDERPMATTAYGARVAVPTDIDMVIAGTSCVDFSKLNSHKKALADGGESGETWNAVLNYCNAFRPAIVVLENVRDAPWDQMLKEFEDIGYDVAGVHVDTKDFYIPHTRQRGYMVCFDSSRLKAAGVKSAGKSWQDLMGSFKRLASSPVSSFLMTSDQLITRVMSRADEAQRDYDWSRCEIRQMNYRLNNKLGNARPVTHWQESGAMLVPDNGSKAWYSSQVERVLDTIDAAVLRKALPRKGGYDCRYKTRIWNLSQNIERDEDSQPFGIVGCITPTGQYFVSDAGRAMTPEELLKLQGLPFDMISFTTESAAEMQDLAGNAMSSSVIGSAIVSALIAGHKAIKVPKTDEDHSTIRHGPVKPGVEVLIPPMESAEYSMEGDGLPVESLLEVARRALRKCYCESKGGLARKPIQQCKDCKHTTCTACGGNPAHNYRQRTELSTTRLLFAEFEAGLRSKLPLRLRMEAVEELSEIIFSEIPKEDKTFRVSGFSDLVRNTGHDEFFFSHFRRTHCITITYHSKNGRLELVIDEVCAEWRFFVKPDKKLPSDDWLRDSLAQPVARSKVKDSLFGGQWQVRVPVPSSTKVRVDGRGDKMPTWWSRIEMPDFTDHWQWEFLDVKIPGNCKPGTPETTVINGKYQYLPKCGTACDSLYKKIDNEGKEDIFLFLDPARTAGPDKDRFVFSTNKALMEYDEVRPFIAALEPSWRPWDKQPFEQPKAKTSSDDTYVTLMEDSKWIVAPNVTLRSMSAPMEISVARNLSAYIAQTEVSKDCETPTALVSCTRHHATGASAIGSIPVRSGDTKFFACNAWQFEALRRQLQSAREWQPIALEQMLQDCERCAPARPVLQWKMSADGDIKPYENPSGAATYERAIKNRPDPIVVEDTGLTGIRLSINLVSLAHRARARLPANTGNVDFDWRCSTNGAAGAFTFRPFTLTPTEGVQPYSPDVLNVDLYPKQCLALAWMRKQEASKGAEFTLEECEEATLLKLGWTVEMRARTSIHVRGGICADHPGFGKTITSLALIASELQGKDASQSLHRSLEPHGQGLIPTTATLIICPAVLLDQWASEIVDKLGPETNYLKIKLTADLGKLSLEDFEKAGIIIVNRTVLGAELYAERVAAFAGVPGPATNKARSFGEWLKYAMSQIPDHLRILRESGKSALTQHIREAYKNRLRSDEFKAAIPSRRLRGKDYVAANDKTKIVKKAAVSTVDTSTIGTPLFELFYFNRIIVDEFHQYEPREYAAITALKSHKRWGLSATPAIGDFYDVSQMSALIGVPLPIGSDARGIMKAKNVRDLRKELTDFERFDSMRTKPSNALHSRIYDLHQRFLSTFVRRNIMDFEEMKYDDYLVPVQLDIDHKALYTELSQHLNSMDMRIKKGSKSKTTDREERLTSILEESESAEEALSKTAAFGPEGAGAASPQDGLSKLVWIRENEANSILHKLQKEIANARTKEPEALQNWINSRLKSKIIGDAETLQAIQDVLDGKALETGPSGKKTNSKASRAPDSDDDEESAPDQVGKTAFISIVNQSAQRLLVAMRSLRFTRAVQLVQQAANAQAQVPAKCDSPICQSKMKHGELGASALCGHMVCKSCFKRMKDHHIFRCPAHGCSAGMDSYHLLWAEKMGDLKTQHHSQFGAKIDAVIDLLEHIRKQKDQAILFVQYVSQLELVKEAFKARKISSIVVDDPKNAGADIERFRTSASASQGKSKNKSEEQFTVIVLNASDESAAGSNLQNANHVIFLSPLLRDTQYGYESTMAQAIGRVRRHGQEKHIHVYRVVAVDTIDVDILEHRERRLDALTEQGSKPIKGSHGDAMEVDDGQKVEAERTQLVRENGRFSLRPQSWLVAGRGRDEDDVERVKGKNRVSGWENFSSLVKFSKAYTEDDD